jgi:hypothetical protein
MPGRDAGNTVRWVGRTPIDINHDGVSRSLRSLGERLSDLGHTADAKVVIAGACAIRTLVYHLEKFTHEELGMFDVSEDEPLFIRSLVEDVIAQLPRFHPAYKAAVRLRGALVSGGSQPVVGIMAVKGTESGRGN